MRNFLIYTHKIFYLCSILSVGCFRVTPEEQIIVKSEASYQSIVDSTLQSHDKTMILFQDELDKINNQIRNNTLVINSFSDSLETFHQLDISGETTDKDIINSLIRIQSKLNLIEEKLFYSDSLYFNLFNDLVLIESQIEDLNQNINNITELT